MKKIKPGYYIEKEEGFIYLYVPESDILKGFFYFLATDSNESSGYTSYDTAELHSRCKYLGDNLNHLVKYLGKS